MKKLMVFAFFSLSAMGTLKAQQTAVISVVSGLNLNDSTRFKDYCGVYKMAENPYIEEVKIELKDGKLISRTPEDEEIVFEYTENDEFFIAPFNATAIFTRENGVVKGVKVKVKGTEMVGEKR